MEPLYLLKCTYRMIRILFDARFIADTTTITANRTGNTQLFRIWCINKNSRKWYNTVLFLFIIILLELYRINLDVRPFIRNAWCRYFAFVSNILYIVQCFLQQLCRETMKCVEIKKLKKKLLKYDNNRGCLVDVLTTMTLTNLDKEKNVHFMNSNGQSLCLHVCE